MPEFHKMTIAFAIEPETLCLSKLPNAQYYLIDSVLHEQRFFFFFVHFVIWKFCIHIPIYILQAWPYIAHTHTNTPYACTIVGGLCVLFYRHMCSLEFLKWQNVCQYNLQVHTEHIHANIPVIRVPPCTCACVCALKAYYTLNMLSNLLPSYSCYSYSKRGYNTKLVYEIQTTEPNTAIAHAQCHIHTTQQRNV